MEESENPTSEQKDTCSSNEKGKPRRRMKAIYGKIREQMEFYFSDANLHKDRFLKKAIEATTDGYVELATFLKFNKLQAITSDAAVLADAIRTTSTFLQINEEKTHIRRTTPIEEPKNVDERTVYVECLPHGVDHEWVKRMFSRCGKVVYVSLPRYPSTGDLKGFAFVEFQTIEEAQAACQELNNPPADSFSKVGMFPKSSSQWEDIKKSLPEDQIEATKEKAKELILSEKKPDDQSNQEQVSDTKDVVSAGKSKRRHAPLDTSTDATQTVPVKRRKVEESSDEQKTGEEQPIETEKGSGVKKKSRKRKSRSKTVDSSVGGSEASRPEDGELDVSVEAVPEKRKKLDTEARSTEKQDGKTKHTDNGNGDENSSKQSQESKKKKKRSRRKKPKKEREIAEVRVIPKTEWLGLRKEYLKLQKTSMALLKKTLKGIKKEETETIETTEEKGDKKKGRTIEFIQGVIVKVSSENPLLRKSLRACLGEGVAYVDVKDGLLEGHIRCDNSKAADTIVNKAAEGYSLTMVTGDAERQYWDKLLADRDTKFNTKCKSKKRGHQKWMEKARKASVDTVERKQHIVFDDN